MAQRQIMVLTHSHVQMVGHRPLLGVGVYLLGVGVYLLGVGVYLLGVGVYLLGVRGLSHISSQAEDDSVTDVHHDAAFTCRDGSHGPSYSACL